MRPHWAKGYFLGISPVQYAVARTTGWLAHALFDVTTAGEINARLSGALGAGVGLFLTLETLEGPPLSVLFAV